MDAFFAAPRGEQRSSGLSPGVSSTRPPLYRSKDRWTTDDADFTVDSTNYDGPNGFFYATKKTATSGACRDSFLQDHQTPRPFTTGLMGSAFEILEGIAAAHGERAAKRNSDPPRRSAVHFESEDEGTFPTKSPDRPRRSPPQHRSSSNDRRSSSSDNCVGSDHHRRRSRDGRHRSNQRSGPDRATGQETTRAPRGWENDREAKRAPEDSKSRTRGASTADIASDLSSQIEALRSTIRNEKRAIETCQRRVAQLSGRSRIRSEDVYKVLKEMEKHEKRLDAAHEDLRSAKRARDRRSSGRYGEHEDPSSRRDQNKSDASRNSSRDKSSPTNDSRRRKTTRQPDQPTHQSRDDRPKPQRYSSGRESGFIGAEALHYTFASFFGHGLGRGLHGFDDPLLQTRAREGPNANDPHFHTPFGNKPFFGFEDGYIDLLFGLPRMHRSDERTAKTSPRAKASDHFSAFQSFCPPKPQPPATWLRPDEAKSLYKTYTEKWAALGPTDPNVPFPGRGLNARSLSKRDSLYAPNISAAVSTWSEENVLQANVQAFFLGAVGLSPVYSETSPSRKLTTSFDKAKASDQQIRELIDVLKKEKVRWHSDRLGRRNGGSTDGPNTALQKDERARAVFHAVCELMEVAQA